MTMTEAEYESEVAEQESEFILKKDTSYGALTGELCGVFCEDLGENDHVIMAPHCM